MENESITKVQVFLSLTYPAVWLLLNIMHIEISYCHHRHMMETSITYKDTTVVIKLKCVPTTVKKSDILSMFKISQNLSLK
jgi:hypothetical protein